MSVSSNHLWESNVWDEQSEHIRMKRGALPFIPKTVSVDMYQLTPMGAARVESGKRPAGISQGGYSILREMYKAGGVMDLDEIRFAGKTPYSYGKVSHHKEVIKKLVDFGFVQRVSMPEPMYGAPGGVPGL